MANENWQKAIQQADQAISQQEKQTVGRAVGAENAPAPPPTPNRPAPKEAPRPPAAGLNPHSKTSVTNTAPTQANRFAAKPPESPQPKQPEKAKQVENGR